ncbi:probable receptor-like protein kinase At1g80640 isoform X2 [Physcomitrium patens]|uniref:Protein kinase domain-containing protein n=1 Tax=Physcomitrium patens TaxID=3218 RepID=A0A2K1KIF9_PHYPA|nr:probable receptor-like protein kinase At1g80640 isoform X2 [Physcomitrium patens]PNR53558.1 hypothetical protein PHYPA_007233 [Physcomitrium patens]|eukprot:XP_024375123.1 probable receptor-like protein kinase At1g80640 isoform X2 [Physcomitrella patens]
MAGSQEIKLVVFYVIAVSAISWVELAQGYRLLPSESQRQHLPLSTPDTNLEDPAIRVGHGRYARDQRSVVPDAVFNTPYAEKSRHLLDFETPAAWNHVNVNWLLVAILTPTSLVAVGIVILLLVLCARKQRNSKPSMLIWTNQSTLQRQCDGVDFSSDSSRSTRFETMKFGPWLNHLQSIKSCVKSGGLAAAPCSLAYSLLQTATNNFSSSNLLGEGSFGHVYKARLDYDVYAAVKRLTSVGKQPQKELQGEVDLMCKIRHPNLVALLGYSNDGPEPLVVYELMQNGSLHDQLHGPSCGSALTWYLRLKIALEAARGLEHLHESCKPAIIHRDFKASNILLDASFNAKVSDFGIAVALEEGGVVKDDVQVQGTFGYIAPEYLMDGTLTEKSDVYGFGVVLLELLTGRLPIDTSLPLGSQSLVTWVTPILTNRAKLMEVIDPTLQDTLNVKQLHQVAAVAVLCVQAEPSYRPLIADVVQSLAPLVPQELGGALRDPKSQCLHSDSGKLSVDPLCGAELMDTELPSFNSQRSDYSLYSVGDDSSISRSSILDRSRSWEHVTRSLELQQRFDDQGN